MRSIAMCRAVCGDCEREFPYPSLGDFAYGEFILHREDGLRFYFLSSFDNAVWNFVNAHVQKNGHWRQWTPIMQEVLARLADKVDGQSFTMQMVCPYCRSRHFRDWGRERISWAEIPEAAFQSFTSLDEQNKVSLVRKLEMEVAAEQSAGGNAASPRASA